MFNRLEDAILEMDISVDFQGTTELPQDSPINTVNDNVEMGKISVATEAIQ